MALVRQIMAALCLFYFISVGTFVGTAAEPKPVADGAPAMVRGPFVRACAPDRRV